MCCIPPQPSDVRIPGLYWGTGWQDPVWDGHRLGLTWGAPTGGAYSEGSSTGRAVKFIISVHPHSILLERPVWGQAGCFTP